MQDVDIDVAKLRDVRAESVRNPRGGKRVGVGRVSVIECDAVVVADRAQRALASAEAVELLVEDMGIDYQHALRSTDPVDQWS